MIHEEHQIIMMLCEGEKSMWTVINTIACGSLERQKTLAYLVQRLISEKKIVRDKRNMIRLHGGLAFGKRSLGTTPRV